MTTGGITLVPEIGRVPSMTVPLDREEEARFQRLMEETIMIDLHQHPFVYPQDVGQFTEYLKSNSFKWAYEAVRHGGWTAVGTANSHKGMLNTNEMSFVRFDDVVSEIAMMLSDMRLQRDVVKVSNADEIEVANQQGRIGFLPTVEHLAIGSELQSVDVLYGMGIRLAGITYNRKNYIGDGIFERNDGGLSEFGIEVVHRMNDLGMVVDVSHASFRTALDAVEFSRTPVTFSHDGAITLRPGTQRLRQDEELLACARKGGIIGITAVPMRLSSDPEQTIEVVLDHFDYMVKLVGVDHVAVGTDTTVGDTVTMAKQIMRRADFGEGSAPYLNGLESPADGKNIIRGLIRRGYTDGDIKKIAGGNALAFFRRVMH